MEEALPSLDSRPWPAHHAEEGGANCVVSLATGQAEHSAAPSISLMGCGPAWKGVCGLVRAVRGRNGGMKKGPAAFFSLLGCNELVVCLEEVWTNNLSG